MAFNAGTRLGAYEILSAVGAGGFGEVYKARDTRLNRTVAIKILSERVSNNAESRQRFEREAQTIAGLKHPNICVLYDIGQQDGTDFLVMEYIEGETLANRLTRGPLPLDQVLKVAIESAKSSLACATLQPPQMPSGNSKPRRGALDVAATLLQRVFDGGAAALLDICFENQLRKILGLGRSPSR
jgi:serine/threonine protein kinase